VIKAAQQRQRDEPVTVGAVPPPSEEDAESPFPFAESEEGERQAEPDWEAMRETVVAGARQDAEKMRREAAEFLEQARLDIAEQDKTAKAEREIQAAEIMKQARDMGFADGLENARRSALEIVERANRDADRLLNSLQGECDALRAEAPALMLRLSLDMAERIVGKALTDDDGAFLAMAKCAVEEAGLVRGVDLRLNPADYERLFKDLASGGSHSFETSRGYVGASLIPDPSVPPLGVRVEYPGGVIEAGAEAGMEKMREAMEA